jgi:curli biogenesis system outer membrane secretion channel CsgG
MRHLLRNPILNVWVFIFAGLFLFGCASIEPTAKATSSAGPTIDEAQKEKYDGPKARIAVTRFEDKSAKGKTTGEIGDGMAEMLGNALFATNRYIVLERQTLGDVIKEQDLGDSGRVERKTAPEIGKIEGADLLIRGTITEFEPGSAGAGGGTVTRGRKATIFDMITIKTSHVAMIVKIIDAKTSRILASEQVEGKATDFGIGTGGAAGGLAGAFGMYSKTPMEKAIRIGI